MLGVAAAVPNDDISYVYVKTDTEREHSYIVRQSKRGNRFFCVYSNVHPVEYVWCTAYCDTNQTRPARTNRTIELVQSEKRIQEGGEGRENQWDTTYRLQ